MADEEVMSRAAHDVNSSSFNVNEYASELLKTRSLPDLMAHQEKLALEGKAFDREMQDLVYNNYPKFIAATDTIRAMKDSVGKMESSMTRLVGEMRVMGGSSALVNDSLQENRGKIEKLVGVKRLLLKLEFLFELPLRLRRAMELDAQSQAVRYFTSVQGVLQKYDHMPSIHAIRLEAEGIMASLREQLRGVLRAAGRAAAGGGGGGARPPPPVAAKVVEAIRLLVALEEPRAPLREAFLAFQKGRLLSGLAAHAARYAPTPDAHRAAAHAVVAADAAAPPSALLTERARGFYAAAAAAKTAFLPAPSTVAAARPRATVPHAVFVQGANRGFLDGFRYAADLFCDLFEGVGGEAGSAPAGEARAAREELLAFTKEVMGVYFATLRKQLSLPPPLPGDEGDGEAGRGGRGRGGRRPSAGAASPASPGAGLEVDDDETEAARAKAGSLAAAAAAGAGAGAGAPGSRYEAVADALRIVLMDVRAAAKPVKEARLPDRAHEAVEAILRAQLDGLFGDARGDVTRLLVALEGRANAAAREGGGGGGGDRTVAVGRALAALAEDAAREVSDRIDAALAEARPLLLASMRLLPDLARAFVGLLHGQVFALLSWLAAAWEAVGDATHPSRAEWADVVVEAALGLEKDVEAVAAAGGARRGGGKGGGASAASGASSASAAAAPPSESARATKRALVNFSAPEADQNAHVPPASGIGGGILTPLGDRHHSLLLLLAALCRAFARDGVTRALNTMMLSLPAASELASMGLPAGGGEEDADSGFGAMAGVPSLIRRVQGAGRALLRRFVYHHGARLGAAVRRALTTGDWLGHGEPSEVRAVVPVVLEDVAALKKVVAATLGDWDAHAAEALARHCGLGVGAVGGGDAVGTDAPPPQQQQPANPFAPTPAPPTLKGPAAGASAAAVALASSARRTGVVVCAAGLGGLAGVGGASAGVASMLGGGSTAGSRKLPVDIDRLFASGGGGGGRGGGGDGGGGAALPDHRLVLGAVDYSADSVCRVLLRLVFKAWVEWTRCTTLSVGGYRQLQCDLAAMHMALPYFCSSAAPPPAGGGGGGFDPLALAGVLEELLHEAAVSAGERCVDPKPLGPAVCHAIATAALARLRVTQAQNGALME